MSRPVNIVIDRIFVPAGEGSDSSIFRDVLKSRLNSELGGGTGQAVGDVRADRAARAIAETVKGIQS